jgi:hypothetical protein
MERKKRPGHLTRYAKHAGISKPAAAEQLGRVGIDYMQPFDFEEADRRRQAMRHADRTKFAKPIYLPGESYSDASSSDSECSGEPPKNPVFAEIQARKEHFKAELARLEYEQAIGKLVEREQVEAEAYRIARLIRDGVFNVVSRLEGLLAAETDQRKVRELLEKEFRQVLDVLADRVACQAA